MGDRKRQSVKKIRMNKKGETLVETIVSFVIVITALAAITAMINSATTMNRKAQEKSDTIEAAATKVEQNAGAAAGDGTLSINMDGTQLEIGIEVKNADLFTYFTYIPRKGGTDSGEEPDDKPDKQDEIKWTDWPDADKMSGNDQVLYRLGGIVKYGDKYYVVCVDTYVNKSQAAAGPANHPHFKEFTGKVLTDADINSNGYIDKVNPGDLYRDKDGKLYVYAQTPGGSWAYPPGSPQQSIYWFSAS